jgi:mannose-6-phosphate isomerase-like protein (cupin superfamily)
MPKRIDGPTRVTAAGSPPKTIDEYVGRVNTDTERLSIAHMRSPQGWEEPGQRPEFDEYTLVLKGMLKVDTESGPMEVRAGQAILTEGGEWVRYSSPEAGGTEYVAICLPAFSPGTVHRDDD